MKKLTYLLCLFAFVACKSGDAKKELSTLVDNYYEEQLKLNPVSATANGDNRYNDQLTITFTDSHLAKVKALLEKTQASLSDIDRDDLDANDQITFDMLKRDVELGLEGLTYPDNLMPLNQFYGFHLTFAQLGSGSVMQPFATKKDYENWEKRMHIGAAYMDSSIVYFKRGIAANVVLPKALTEKIIPQLTSFEVQDLSLIHI
jgi:uncharacterized protein (DUF885 family)